MVPLNMTQTTLKVTKRKITVFAIITRLTAIFIQFIANAIIPDHDANVFLYPKSNLTDSFYDDIVTSMLGGFVRWDAQYFIHIAKYGYTYENTLAFFPLYPLLVKIISTTFVPWTAFLLNEDSILLLIFIILNCYLVCKSAIILYELSLIILKENNLAYKAAMLFCINPATVFFVAPYSESLFCYLSLKMMLNCSLMFNEKSTALGFKNLIYIIIPLSLSTCVRSNGILNIGFIIYSLTRYAVECLHYSKVIKDQFIFTLKYAVLLIMIVVVCMLPFTLVQIYDYYQYCTDFLHNLPEIIVNFGLSNNFVLPGQASMHKQSWCLKKLPLAYSYIQDHYWNVGFMRYFEFKQIPNFILALPIVYIIIKDSIQFFRHHKNYCLNLGIFNVKFVTKTNTKDYLLKKEIFVFVVHALFLTIFCVFCIHVQVTTRIVCSASPVLYWFAAHYFESVKEKDQTFKNIFLFNENKNHCARYTTYYFLSYFVVGVVMFSNFLPWT